MKLNITGLAAAGALLGGALLPLVAAAADATDPASTQQLQQMQQSISALSQQLDALKAQLEQLKATQAASAETTAQQAAQPQVAAAGGGTAFENISLWGYGEVYYSRPIHDTSLTQADLARAVFGIGYTFDERTQFNSEFEVEHAVSSASDPGEVEVEQFYVNHQFDHSLALKGGLFLIPSGLLNLTHEPTHFYGMQRNFVETLIIPSTWREGGLALSGDTSFGFGWELGLTTGFDLGKWEVNPEFPLYRNALDIGGAGPLQASHQELALANAEHLAEYVALNYHGIPGFVAGGSVFTSRAAVAAVPEGLPSQRATLWEVHARWTPPRTDLSALYARGTISNTAAFNLANTGASNLVPALFLGYYFQGAYNVWERGDTRVAPFVRWEHYDIGARYEGVPAGFTPVPTGPLPEGFGSWPIQNDRVWTYGVNYYPNAHLVIKADYQDFANNRDFTRFDLGLGLDF